MDNITNFIEDKLQLKVNRSKSAVERPWKRKFLGFTIILSFRKACSTISKQSLRWCKGKLGKCYLGRNRWLLNKE